VFKVDFLRPTRFLDIKADKKWEGVRRLNFKEAIETDKKWEGVRRPNFKEAMKTYKKWEGVFWPTTKKLGTNLTYPNLT
jgi:hypothetical protein